MKRVQISITGIVQGVGFRPTVYQYACRFNLSGFVNNTVHGVFIEVQGDDQKVDEFILFLEKNPPPQAHVDQFLTKYIPLLPEKESFSFEIIQSHGEGSKEVEISPDLAVCTDCQKDIFDPSNRRYFYPFTNCTNCGPRFTIIKDRPYDRAYTSMQSFPMCSSCQQEYENPLDRRFHAQPNACPECGPKLHLLPNLSTHLPPLQYTGQELKKGSIVAIKGLGGFNLACDPWNEVSVMRLRQFKKRPTKSFALMARNLDVLNEYVEISPTERRLLTSAVAPIVLLKKKGHQLDHIAPDNNYLGVMLAYTPLHHLLFQDFDLLIMTSANHADEPIAHTDEAITQLIEQGLADFALSHNREIVHRADDSIVSALDDEVQLIRRSRGYVPRSIQIDKDSLSSFSSALGFGSHMKNCFALRSGKKIYLSQHIGDLEDARTIHYQDEQIKDLKQLLEIKPQIEIVDAHPGFEHHQSEGQIEVFHHHAHALSVMAEHQLLGKKVIALIADGTGHGQDGILWGWEFLSVNEDYRFFNRMATLSPFPLPGGAKAIHEIDRIGIALALKASISPDLLPFYSTERCQSIARLIELNLNCPKTSALGRLFDGVASILGITQLASYEAQGAILLQKYAELAHFDEVKKMEKLPILFREGNSPKIEIDPLPMIGRLLKELEDKKKLTYLAFLFHLWVVDIMVELLGRFRDDSRLIVLSGGCFQNQLLYRLLTDQLKQKQWPYYINKQVPCNDAGLGLGQSIF